MKMTWIEPNILAASSIPYHPDDIQSLYAKGIRAILSLPERSLLTYRGITTELFNQLDITYHHVPVVDDFPPSHAQAVEIMDIFERMEQAQRPLLVHCNAGVGRTGTVLHLFYLYKGYSLQEANALVRQKRIQCILLSKPQQAFLEECEQQNRSK